MFHNQNIRFSSLWDKFRTSINQLTRVARCHGHFCASRSICNDFKGSATDILDAGCTSSHSSTLFAVHDPAHFASDP
eukprot:930018-Pleurochrysis_carterae.AAC.4